MKKSRLKEENAMLLSALHSIYLFSVDYDGEKTAKGLKGLVDELKVLAEDAMYKDRKIPEGYESWRAYAKRLGLIQGSKK